MGCSSSSTANDVQQYHAGGGKAGGTKKLAPKASKGRWTDLHEAAEVGNEHQVRSHLQAVHPDIGDRDCWTPLLEACERGHTHVVEALLAGRANPDIADKKGWTPLMAAAEKGSSAIASMLLAAGGSPNWQDEKGWTCTMEAAERCKADCVQVFIAGGAELNAADDKGWTAFMAACEGGDINCVKQLWIAGSEHNMVSSYGAGWTALDEAREKKRKDIVDFMEPIVDAEKNLKKMIDTDNWQPLEALQYMERAQMVWCLKGLVAKATDRLIEVLQQHIIDQSATDREECFDSLMTLDSSVFTSEVSNNEGNANDSNNNNTTNETNNINNVSSPAPEPGLQRSATKPGLQAAAKEICQRRLAKASTGQSVPEIKWAMSAAVKTGTSKSLTQEMEAVKSHYKELVVVPPGWDLEAMAQHLTNEGRMVAKKVITDPEVHKQMQALLDGTYRRKYTRDRKGGRVPDRLLLERVVSVQNDMNYQEYTTRCKTVPAAGPPPETLPEILTKGVECPCLPALDASRNEAWLFHGTSEYAAQAITDTDFRLNLAGTNAGTLYGCGIYFGDSCSKSDEYCTANAENIRCIILCRVALGRIHYTDEVSPDAKELTRSCLAGEYDSVLGDREKCRGTYKEFIVFDDDLAYPEFVLYYRRHYDKGGQ